MTSILEVIKALRRFRKYSQEFMAEKLHISLRAYQKIESGKTKLDMDRLKMIADALGVSLVDLVNAKSKAERLLPVSQVTTYNKGPSKHGSSSYLLKRILEIIIESKEREVSYLQVVAEQEV